MILNIFFQHVAIINSINEHICVIVIRFCMIYVFSDEKAIVICNWNAKLQSKKDPCMYNEKDVSVTEPNLYTLSVEIKNNNYNGTFYFKRFSDIIDCFQRKGIAVMCLFI